MQITQYGNVDLTIQFKIYAQDVHTANYEHLNQFIFKYLTQFHYLNNDTVSMFEYKVLSILLDEVGRKYKYLFDKNNVLSEYIERHNGYIHIEVDINLSNIEVKKYSYNAEVQLINDKIINVNNISLYDNDRLNSIYTITALRKKLENILSTNIDDNFFINDINIENRSNFDDEKSLITAKKAQLLGKVL